MSFGVILLILLGIILIAIGVYFYMFRKYVKAAPNEILIVSGGKKSELALPDGSKKEIGYRYQIGGNYCQLGNATGHLRV